MAVSPLYNFFFFLRPRGGRFFLISAMACAAVHRRRSCRNLIAYLGIMADDVRPQIKALVVLSIDADWQIGVRRRDAVATTTHRPALLSHL